MGSISNFFSTICYNLSKKSEPIFNDYYKIITNFTELTPKSTSPYDMSNYQYYTSGPTPNGLFTCQRMTQTEMNVVYNKYKTEYPNGPEPKVKWKYKSTACNSYDKFRIDIYKPGRIVVKSTLPKYGCVSPWIYMSMNKGDFTNPYLLPIDKPTEPREYYFEIDMYETFFEHNDKQRIAFSGHYGTQQNREMKTLSIKGDFDMYHFSEVKWDGKGNWTWLLDSVVLYKTFIPQPKNIAPFFKLTFIVFPFDDIPSEINKVEWKVDYVKFSNNLITTGLSL
jgi:hypothetical protein